MSACSDGPKGWSTQPKSTQIVVKVIPVSDSQSSEGVSYVGTIEPVKSTTITSPYGGTLVSVRVKQGDRVRQGQVIAEISSSSVESAYQTAQATLRQAQDGYERASQVYASGSIADVKMVEIETQLAKAQAMEQTARKAREDCRIKAPYSGTIGDVLANQGEELTLSAPIVRLLDLSDLEIDIPVPEAELSSIAIGDRAEIVIPAIGRQTSASITRKGVVASSLSHSYECTLGRISDPQGLMPGMTCKVYIKRQSCEQGLVVPAGAIMTGTNGRYVWTVTDGVVGQRYIKVAGYQGDGILVSEGLEDVDSIIVEGARKVSTGMKVLTEVVK